MFLLLELTRVRFRGKIKLECLTTIGTLNREEDSV